MLGSDLAANLGSWVVRTVLPNQNPRMMCPPAPPGAHGRPNVVVATPMRSGTHLLMDLLLNNLSAYRTRPLYVNLDRCVYQSTPQRNLVAEIAGDAGHIVKTHMPVLGSPPGASNDPEVLRILESAVVLTVRRRREDVLRSLEKWGWGDSPTFLQEFESDWDGFWAFWEGRETLSVEFSALLDPARAQEVLRQVAELTGTTPRSDVLLPLPPSQRRRIYLNKAMTRLVGRRAPRIDTTIQTLKG